ncbi:hypothetical protein ACVQTW_000628 [Klebsiella aerogenes]
MKTQHLLYAFIFLNAPACLSAEIDGALISNHINDRQQVVINAIVIAENLIGGKTTVEEVKRSQFFDRMLTISPKTKQQVERVTFEKKHVLSLTIEREYKNTYVNGAGGWYEAVVFIHNEGDRFLFKNCNFIMDLNLSLMNFYKKRFNFGPNNDESSYYAYDYEKKSAGNMVFHFMVSPDFFVSDSFCPDKFHMVRLFLR